MINHKKLSPVRFLVGLLAFIIAASLFLSVPTNRVAAQTAPNTANMSVQELLAMIEQLTRLVAILQAQVAAQVTQSAPATPSTFFTNPVQTAATNDSISFLQRILATDPAIYPEGMITGYFGTLTEAALRRFQTNFGLTVTGVFNNETSFVLTSALQVIPFTDAPTTYLREPSVQTQIRQSRDVYRANQQASAAAAANASPTNTTTATTAPQNTTPANAAIASLVAQRDFRTNTTLARVYYQDHSYRSLSINRVKPTSTIESMIASTFNIPPAQVRNIILYADYYGKDLQELIMRHYSVSNRLELEITYVDDTTETERVTEEHIRRIVTEVFQGDRDYFNAALLSYIEQVRNGERPTELIQLISTTIGVSTSEINRVLEFEVDQFDWDMPFMP